MYEMMWLKVGEGEKWVAVPPTAGSHSAGEGGAPPTQSRSRALGPGQAAGAAVTGPVWGLPCSLEESDSVTLGLPRDTVGDAEALGRFAGNSAKHLWTLMPGGLWLGQELPVLGRSPAVTGAPWGCPALEALAFQEAGRDRPALSLPKSRTHLSGEGRRLPVVVQHLVAAQAVIVDDATLITIIFLALLN